MLDQDENARPHVARKTKQKLPHLEYEIWTHFPILLISQLTAIFFQAFVHFYQAKIHPVSKEKYKLQISYQNL